MTTRYTQDSTPTNPFGAGWYQQAVDRSERLLKEREATQLQLDAQLNDGPYAYRNVRDSRIALRELQANPNANPATVAAAQAKYDELQAGRQDLALQSENNVKLTAATQDGLSKNQISLSEAQAKAANTPPGTVIVNAGNDSAANSTPPVVSASNITGTNPPLNVNTPNSLRAEPVTAADQATNDVVNTAGTSPTPVNPNTDPEIGDLEAAQAAAAARVTAVPSPEDVQAGLDEALAAQEQEEDTEPRVFTAEDLGVDPLSDEAILAQQQQQAENRAILRAAEAPNPYINGTPYDDDGNLNPGWSLTEDGDPVFVGGGFVEPATAASAAGSRTAAAANRARQQSTLQTRVNQPAAADWRVRLRLAPNADYLYKATGPGILAPLAATDGVVFPYTPVIETSYQAKYDSYDLTHSNYRGYFYKNSTVENITIKGTFTAQDTREAQYLLAVIHFFKSVTKMFYGQDQQAGTPPPLVYLSGFGKYQFNENPCVLTNFGYSLPNDVDYIRADGFNNIGLNMGNRRSQSSGPAIGGSLGTVVAILDRLTNSGLGNGSLTNRPSPGQVNQNVANQTSINSTYVPTKMEISITLLPMQTRNQVSKQFSLKSFANGSLLAGGGFW